MKTICHTSTNQTSDAAAEHRLLIGATASYSAVESIANTYFWYKFQVFDTNNIWNEDVSVARLRVVHQSQSICMIFDIFIFNSLFPFPSELRLANLTCGCWFVWDVFGWFCPHMVTGCTLLLRCVCALLWELTLVLLMPVQHGLWGYGVHVSLTSSTVVSH